MSTAGLKLEKTVVLEPLRLEQDISGLGLLQQRALPELLQLLEVPGFLNILRPGFHFHLHLCLPFFLPSLCLPSESVFTRHFPP